MNGFREKFDKLNDKIYHTLNIDGKTGEIIETMNYNIKKGLVKGTDLLGEHLVESGLLSQNPFITGIGVFVNSNKDGFRDVIMEKNNIEYLDKKIKEECRNRPHRNEYKSMSPDEKKIDDALWRRKRWMEEGLDSKRKLLGYDRMIEWALEECKKKEVLRAKFDRKIDMRNNLTCLNRQIVLIKQMRNNIKILNRVNILFGISSKKILVKKQKKLHFVLQKHKLKREFLMYFPMI